MYHEVMGVCICISHTLAMNRLPPEMLVHAASFLDNIELFEGPQFVCKWWRGVCLLLWKQKGVDMGLVYFRRFMQLSDYYAGPIPAVLMWRWHTVTQKGPRSFSMAVLISCAPHRIFVPFMKESIHNQVTWNIMSPLPAPTCLSQEQTHA